MYRKLFIILFVLLIPRIAFGANYCVTQDGTGTCGAVGATHTITQFNALTGTGYAGDTFYFSGTLTTQIYPQISGTSGGGYVTLDGYQASNSYDVVANGGTHTSACNIDLTENSTSTNTAFYVENVSYIIIQDFDAYNLCNGLKVKGGDHIKLRRTHIHDAHYSGIDVSDGSASSYITIGTDLDYSNPDDGNIIEDTLTVADGNRNVGFENANDIVVSGNRVTNTSPSFESENNIGVNQSQRILIQYNDISNSMGGSGISIKENTPFNQDVVIRFNHIHDENCCYQNIGMSIGYSTNNYVYGNMFYDIRGGGIRFKEGSSNNWAWSNIIANDDQDGQGLWMGDYGGLGAAPPDGANFINNTVYSNDYYTYTSYYWGVALHIESNNGADINFFNNVLMDSNPYGATDYHAAIETSPYAQFVDGYNTWWNPGGSSSDDVLCVNSASTCYNSSELGSSNETRDPDFDSVASVNGFKLNATSNEINSGADLSQCFDVTIQGIELHFCIDEGVDPNNTDWTTVPPTVLTLMRDDYKRGTAYWDRGAYVYSLSVYDVSPIDGATEVSVTGLAIWDYNADAVDDVEIWLDSGACDGTPDDAGSDGLGDESSGDADKQYDMSTLSYNTTYCLTIVANKDAAQGDFQQFEFTTEPTPSASHADRVIFIN